MKRLIVSAVVLICVALPIAVDWVQAVPVRSQQSSTAQLSFDVASVKLLKEEPTEESIPKMGCRGTDGASRYGGPLLQQNIPRGHCMASYYWLKAIIGFAYDKPWMQFNYAIAGGPQWLDTDRFVIDAKTDAPATEAQLRSMFRSLLAERFRLAVHEQEKVMDVFTLVLDDKGSKLTPSKGDGDCGTPSPTAPCGFLSGNSATGLHGVRVPLDTITVPLSLWGGLDTMMVVDGTGLTGLFDISTTGWNQTDDPSARAYRPNFPSVQTMLNEQLGLKLKKDKKPVQVLIIDHVEKLAEN